MGTSLNDLGRFLTKTIDDPIPRHAEKPGARLLDRLHQPVRLNQFEENVLQDIFRILIVFHPRSDEIEQPAPFALDHLGEASILLARARSRCSARPPSTLKDE